MKKKKYKRGDVVQLKSGGPKMIIDEVPRGLDLSNPNIDERDSYFCRWCTAESGSYAEELLELVDTKNEKQSKENNARAIKRCKMDAGDA